MDSFRRKFDPKEYRNKDEKSLDDLSLVEDTEFDVGTSKVLTATDYDQAAHESSSLKSKSISTFDNVNINLGFVRPDQINFQERLNKTQFVHQTSGASTKSSLDGKTKLIGKRANQPGFYCEVCDLIFKDNMSFLEHINTRQHQMKLGIDAQLRKIQSNVVSVQAVREKFAELKKRRDRKTEFNFEERLKQVEKIMEIERSEKRRKKKEKKNRLRFKNSTNSNEDVNGELEAAMGFGGFGSTKA